MSDLGALLRWLLALEVIGWGLFPLLYLAVPGLRDRGLAVAKPFALLLLVYPVWFLAALGLPLFTAPVLLVAGVLLAALGWALALRQRPDTAPGADAAPARPPLVAFLRESWRYVILAEAVFIGAFFFYAWLRGYNPQISGTEKPMEIGFLSAATRQATMPPTDPWLSGHGINYYYLGYVLIAALAKLTVISSSVAFNFGLATVFAMTLSGGAGVTANLLAVARDHGRAVPRARTLALGLLGGYLLAVAGNMYAAGDILARGREAIDVWWWGGLGWKSSRVVVDSGFPEWIFGPNFGPSDTITEFPYFSFILGDLHAHVLALPFALLALTLALDIFLAPLFAARADADASREGDAALAHTEQPEPAIEVPMVGLPPDRAHAPITAPQRADLDDPATAGDTTAPPGEPAPAEPSGERPPSAPQAITPLAIGRLALAALVIGGLYAINSWDLPTYAAIYLAAGALPLIVAGRAIGRREWLAAAAFAVACFALYLPFHARFTSLVGGQPFELPEPLASIPLLGKISAILGLVVWRKTPTDQFFTVYFLPWIAGLLFLAWRWREGRRATPTSGYAGPVLIVLLLAFVSTLLQMPVLLFAGTLLLLAGAIVRQGRAPRAAYPAREDGDLFAIGLFAAAFALVLATEVFFIHDVFANRMNTIFKVYYQAWTLLAVAVGYAIVRIATLRPQLRADFWRVPATVALTLLVLATLGYPIYGTRARTDQFARRDNLDGLAFVREVQPEEWAGITWVRANIPSGSVVAEAPGCSYGEFFGVPHDRVSAFAGVTTPLGWGGHESQWRGGSRALLDQLGPRAAEVNRLYSTTDPAEALALIERLQVEYVYVGIFERRGYSIGGIGADCEAGGNYPAEGLAKFDTLLDRVFASENGEVVIYKRKA